MTPSDDELRRALANLASNTQSHYLRAYRAYRAGDHSPAKTALYNLVMRKVHGARRAGDDTVARPMLGAIGLVAAVVAFAFGAGMMAFQLVIYSC